MLTHEHDLTLITVPHTGTRWTERLFTSAKPRWHELGLNYHGPRHSKPHLYMGHCQKLGQTEMAIDRGTPVIMCMRHPYRVEEAWRRRDKPLSELLRAYGNMLDVLLPHVTYWCPIDASPLHKAVFEQQMMDRYPHVERWLFHWDRVKNSEAQSRTHAMSVEDCDPSEPIRLVRQNKLFTEFYGDWREEYEAIDRRRHDTARP